jgi:hypothetical protein
LALQPHEVAEDGGDVAMPPDEGVTPFWVFVPLVGEVFLLVRWVGHPPPAVAVLDVLVHAVEGVAGGGEQVAFPCEGAGCECGDQNGWGPVVRVVGEAEHAVPFEDLHDPLQGAADFPFGHVVDVDVPRRGDLGEVVGQVAAGLEPGCVADWVAVLPQTQLGCVKDLGQFLGLLIRQRLLLVGAR